MNRPILLLAPMAFLLSASAGAPLAGEAQASPGRSAPEAEPPAAVAEPAAFLASIRRIPAQAQVRVEQRVIIRISPRVPESGAAFEARVRRMLPREEGYREAGAERCVPIEAIAGIQPANDNRLLLYMRNRQVMSARLERNCNAQDFYSGAYVERSEDGRFCSQREELRSRSGARCEVAQISRLVAVGDD